MADSTFEGVVEHSNIPQGRRGLSVDIAFFHVPDINSPPPFAGDPPGDAVTDCHKIYENVDLESDSISIPNLIPFSIPRDAGVYYLQIRAILYRFSDGQHFAQHEQFFFSRRPLELTPEHPAVTLPMEWPDIPLEDLGVYGIQKPTRKWPWPLSLMFR